MISLIYVLIVVLIQLIAPSYVGVLIVIANFFLPDTVPVIDEVLGVMITLGKVSN